MPTQKIATAFWGLAVLSARASNEFAQLYDGQLIERIVAQQDCVDAAFYHTKWNGSIGMWRHLLPRVYASMEKLPSEMKTIIETGDVYQFGVYHGMSMRTLRHMKPFATSKIWGFDSFQGLPQPNTSKTREMARWRRGSFKADPREQLRSELRNVDFVAGFYSESLAPSDLRQRLGLKPAMYVDIDVDLYTSTLEVHTFMFRNNLIRPGTIIGYDDWWSAACTPEAGGNSPLTFGEGLAHTEIATRHNVTFLCVAGGCRNWQGRARTCSAFGTVFMVTSINNPNGPDTGFDMDTAQIDEFRLSSPVCSRSMRHLHSVG